MAIRRRYYHDFASRSGDTYKVSLWDLDHPSTNAEQNAIWGWLAADDDAAKEIDVLFDSIEIKWDGDNSKVHQPILGSSLKMSVLATTDDHMGIVKALKHSTEFRIGVKVERYNYTSTNYEPYWYGVVLPEAVTYDYSDLPCRIDINATDGLSTLRDKAYVQSDDSLYGQAADNAHQPAQVQIGNCLQYLPHLALWGEQDNFFYECVDIFHESHATLDDDDNITSIESILNNTGCNVNIWYEKRDVDPPFFRDTQVRQTGATCYDVISNWMVTLGLRLCHVNGAFLAVSPFADRSNINSRLFKYDKRTMVDTSYQYSDAVAQDSNTDLLPDELDLTSDVDILEGSTRSFLHPVRAMYYKHLQGGAARIFPETKWTAIEGDFPQTDLSATLLGQIYDISENLTVGFPLANDDLVVPTAIPLRMTGILQHFFRPADTTDEDTAIGAQFEVKMKIKVGSHYLKQTVGLEADDNLDNDSNFGKIVKSGSDITTWKPLIITSDVEWTSNSADRFSFPAFLDGTSITPSVEPLEYDAGDGNLVNYPCGFGCRRHPDNPNQMKYDNVSRGMWLQAYEVDLDFTLPELPNANVEETGIEMTCEIIMYKNDGTTTTTQADVYPTNALRPDGARIIKFNMFVGDGSDEADAFYFSELDSKYGREMVVGGETLIASRVDETYGEIGTITANTAYTHKWHSENDFTLGSGRHNLAVLAEEHVRIRGVAREAFNLRFLLGLAETSWVHPLHTIKFSHDGGNVFMRPMNMTYALSEGVLSVEGYQTGRDTGTITEVNDSNKKDGGVGSSGGGGGISGTRPEYRPRNSSGSSNPGISPDDQTKLDGIEANATANATNEQLRDRSTHTGTQTASTISNFASAVAAVTEVANSKDVTDLFTTNAGGTAFTSIPLEGEVVRATNIETNASRSFATTTQLNAIASNTLSITSNTSSISDIEDKTDFISITEQHNLDTTKDKVGHITIDGTNGITSLTIKDGSTPIDADEVSTSGTTNKFATQAQLNKVNYLTVTAATDLNSIRTRSNFILATQQGITGFTVPSGGQPLESKHIDDSSSDEKFTDADGVQALGHISSNSVGITTFTTNDGSSGESVNLYHLHNAFLPGNTSCTNTGVYSDSCSAIKAGSRLPDPDADRSSQTGDKLIVIGDDGNYDEIADGTKSQVLTTSGLGVLSWTSLTYPVASLSGRVTTSYANNYYYGSSSYGWNYPIWSSISFNNTQGNPYARKVNDDYAHCGIVAPMGIKNLRVYGTVRNDSGTENILLFLGKTSTPNGSSSQMTLTELGTQTITVSNQDRHYDVDFSTTGTVAAGDLIFVGIARASTTSGTRYINFSLSIQGTV